MDTIKISDMAPDIQKYLEEAKVACEVIDKQYQAIGSVEDKLDFVFELVKALLMAPAIKEAGDAHKWDALLKEQRNAEKRFS